MAFVLIPEIVEEKIIACEPFGLNQIKKYFFKLWLHVVANYAKESIPCNSW